MSETSETKGRCYKETKASRDWPTDHLAIADAIDRLAADVEAIKEAVCDGSVAEERDRFFAGWAAALNERDKLRAEVERLKAELAARPAANSWKISNSSPAAPPPAVWLTEEERRILSAHVQALRDQRRAMERGGQTLGYSANPCALKREADAIDALLARAGSPPVVEVPDLPSNHYARSEAERYRVAIDKAGVSWKEVGRE